MWIKTVTFFLHVSDVPKIVMFNIPSFWVTGYGMMQSMETCVQNVWLLYQQQFDFFTFYKYNIKINVYKRLLHL